MVIFTVLLSGNTLAFSGKINFYNSSVAELDKINFNSLSSKDGLTSDLITYIYQDSIGYMWIGTEDGLNQYNGNIVVQYNYEKNNKFIKYYSDGTYKSITNNYITDIDENESGEL